jgi:hypothetical protein
MQNKDYYENKKWQNDGIVKILRRILQYRQIATFSNQHCLPPPNIRFVQHR